MKISRGERLLRIDELDLEPVAYKLMHPHVGAAVRSLAAVDHDIAMYRVVPEDLRAES